MTARLTTPSSRSWRPTALKTAAATAVLALALAGCNANSDKDSASPSASGTTTETQDGGTLTILTSATQVEWDPAKSQNLAITTLGLVERRLTTWGVEPGKAGVVVPDLATDTGTVSDDGTTWTYTLKDDLFFEDGTPITSADVKYGVERSFAPELSGGLGYHKSLLVGGDEYVGPFTGADLPSIETPDDKTIVFHLKSAYGDWPWIVSQPAFAPVPESADTTTYSTQPVASGPYRVAETKQGVSITLERNEKWDPKTDDVRTAGPDSIVFSLGQDATVTAQRLIADAGEDKNAFGASFVPPAQLAQIANNASAKERLVTSDAGALAYLAINTERDGLDNVKVRQAIQYAVDKQAFQVASGGEIGGAFASTLITPGIEGRVDFDLYEAPVGGDVDKAKALLAESGWDPASRELILVSEDDSVSLAKAQAVEQGLERAGFKVTIKPEAQTAATQTLTQGDGDYDLNVSAWQPDFPSANGNIQPLFDSSQIGNGGWNISRFSDPAVDALIAQATAEIDPVKAGVIWAQADKAIMEASPVVPLLYVRNSFLHGSNVQNFYIPTFPAYPNYLKASLGQ